MFDFGTILRCAVLSIPVLVLTFHIIKDNPPHPLQDCCDQIGMEFHHMPGGEYACLDYKDHSIVRVIRNNNQCFYGD